MSDLRYRICPCGPDGWKVQKRWLGLFWRDLYENTGPDYFERIEFDTESAAETYIQGQYQFETRARLAKQRAALRSSIPPRVVPPAGRRSIEENGR